jgi:Rod binding domain-containing protein
MNISSLNTQLVQQTLANARGGNPLESLDLAALTGDEAAMLQAAQEFEVYFIQTMFRAMRETTKIENTLFPRSQTEEIFQDMLDEQTARAAVAAGRGVGLAKQIFRQMSFESNLVREAVAAGNALAADIAQYDGSYGAAIDEEEEN